MKYLQSISLILTILQTSLLFLTFERTVAHSFLINPKAATMWCRGCQVCQTKEWAPRDVDHWSENPTGTWRRGDDIFVSWAKNNHNGGFVRISIVPVSQMFSPSAHRRYSIYHGCFEQGLEKCPAEVYCGTDRKRLYFHRLIRIPEVIPDGVYAFAFMWYGGIEYKREKGKFEDYTSCSFIRIRGGNIKFSYQPFFKDGDLGDLSYNNKCLVSSTYPGQCLKGCPFKISFYSVPYAFMNGKWPPPLRRTDYVSP